MARTNKYTSLNFNDIYETKKPTSSSSIPSSTAKTILSNSRIHGNMLVLTRPKPIPIPPPQQPPPPPPPATPLQDPPLIGKDSISLRPLGRTGSPSPNLSNLTVSVTPKANNKFVPPHLRPGFNGKEERLEIGVQKQSGSGFRQSGLGSPVGCVEEGRPKSGGGYERGRGNLMAVNRPRSSGSNRPYSSG